MSIAPEPYLQACLRVLFVATTYCRNMAAGKKTSYKQMEDLMDAVNHIPELLSYWERFDESRLKGLLATYDGKWARQEPHLCLQAIYDHALREAQESESS